jgi:hypothetical protein
MYGKQLLTLFTGLAVFGLAACDRDDRTFEQTEREIFTEPTTETIEVDVLTEDTLMVERTTETRVDVDTVRIDGDDPRATGAATPPSY